MDHSLVSLNHMAASVAGLGTISVTPEASSPKSLLQDISNFFTFGRIRQNNEKQYQAFVQLMADVLIKNECDRKKALPQNIILNDFKGYKVTFSLADAGRSSKRIIVNVSKNGESESAQVSADIFEKVCKTLLFRHEFSIPQYATVLSPNGGMYLQGADLSDANLMGEDLSYADLSHAIMEESNLFMADLSHANLQHSNLSGVLMNHTDLSGACLEGAIITGGVINNCKFVNANLENASLLGSSIVNGDFSHANMKFAVLSDVTLRIQI